MRSSGTAAALAAAVLFGVSAPAAKALVAAADPLMLGATLYLGAGLGLSVVRLARPADGREAPLRAADLPLLLAVTVAGAVVGPWLLLLGLRRVTAVTGSLVLNLEAPLTIGIAVLFGEHLGMRGALGAACIVAGTVVLGIAPRAFGSDALGVLAVAGACLAWAVDNNLTSRLAARDPLAVARAKGLLGGAIALIIAWRSGSAFPSASTAVAALALGVVSYGVSVALAVLAMRAIGVARQAAIFATAPFVGAVASVVVLGDPFGWRETAAAAAMAAGLRLLLGERHTHFHVHEPLVHEHRHVHDEHHRHVHGPADPTGEPHSHEHSHEGLAHEHAHVSDIHHRHH